MVSTWTHYISHQTVSERVKEFFFCWSTGLILANHHSDASNHSLTGCMRQQQSICYESWSKPRNSAQCWRWQLQRSLQKNCEKVYLASFVCVDNLILIVEWTEKRKAGMETKGLKMSNANTKVIWQYQQTEKRTEAIIALSYMYERSPQ